MHDDQAIEKYLAAILTESGLPGERRAEVAEELRGHLERSIEANRDAGLCGHEATKAALAEFGPAHVIRKQLRRHQYAIDHDHAMAEMRRHLLFFALLTALPTTFLLYKTNEVVSLSNQLAALAAFFTTTVGTCCIWTYTCAFFGRRIREALPRAEYSFIANLWRWFLAATALFTVSLLWLGAGLLTSMYLIMSGSASYAPAFAEYPGFFWRIFVQGDSFGKMLIGLCVMSPGPALAFAFIVAVYRRSRCTKAVGIAAPQ